MMPVDETFTSDDGTDPDAPVGLVPVTAMSDREILESILAWQREANSVIRMMQAKLDELMGNPMLQNLLSMMG